MELPDALLPRTGSGTDYFSLAILRQLEHLGVPVINPSSAIGAVKDKLYAHQLLAQRNLPIPGTMLVRFPVDPDLVAAQIGFPCVVKLLVGSYGEGIYLSRDPGSFRDLMELVSSLDRTQPLILQEYIATQTRRRSAGLGGGWPPARCDAPPQHRWQFQGQHQPRRRW